MSEDRNKNYPLRLPTQLYDRIARIAEREMRSVNTMIVLLLLESVKRWESGVLVERDREIEESIEALDVVAV